MRVRGSRSFRKADECNVLGEAGRVAKLNLRVLHAGGFWWGHAAAHGKLESILPSASSEP